MNNIIIPEFDSSRGVNSNLIKLYLEHQMGDRFASCPREALRYRGLFNAFSREVVADFMSAYSWKWNENYPATELPSVAKENQMLDRLVDGLIYLHAEFWVLQRDVASAARDAAWKALLGIRHKVWARDTGRPDVCWPDVFKGDVNLLSATRILEDGIRRTAEEELRTSVDAGLDEAIRRETDHSRDDLHKGDYDRLYTVTCEGMTQSIRHQVDKLLESVRFRALTPQAFADVANTAAKSCWETALATAKIFATPHAGNWYC